MTDVARLEDNNTIINFRGEDRGRKKVIAYNPKTQVVVFKDGGYKDWACLGQPFQHVPVEYVVAMILDGRRMGIHGYDKGFRHIEEVCRWPARPSKDDKR